MGAANLYIETKKFSMMYAASFLKEPIATFSKMSVRPADYLLINCVKPEPNTNPNLSRKKELMALVARTSQILANGSRPVILCNPVSHASEITYHLNQAGLPLAVHNSIFKINRAHEAYGSLLGKYSFYSSRYTRNKVILFPLSDARSPLFFRKPLPKGKLLLVQGSTSSLDEIRPDVLRPIEDSFNLSSQPTTAELREIIQGIGPKKVFLYGPYAHRYRKILDALKTVQVDEIASSLQSPLF